MRPRQIDKLGTFGGSGGPIVPPGGKSAVPISLVEPAATFTSATPSSAAAGADTLLTSAGVHGLTAAVSVGASIYISGGTGWTPGFHKITAIAVDTTGTTIQIDTPFSGGMGTPTIALANTQVTLASISVPPLLPNSCIEIDVTYSATVSGNIKRNKIVFGGVDFTNVATTTSPVFTFRHSIANRGATNSQTGSMAGGLNVGYGITATWPTTATIDTSSIQTLEIAMIPTVANEVVSIERYYVVLFM